jgi:hypothetical protein
MTERCDLQTVLHQHLPTYQQQHRLSPRQRQVCTQLLGCRTAALGGQQMQCDQCPSTTAIYHACRDRHCPRCQHHASARWCQRQCAAVLPVRYYHLVFTLPSTLNPWVQLHPEVIYRTLFQCVWAALSRFAADPRRYGGQLGMTAVLHTWGQTLTQHVHLHCLVPGGVLTEDGQWRGAKGLYLFPVKALSRALRGAMVSALRAAAKAGELHRVTHPGNVDTMLDTLMRTEWVVYTKACPAQPHTAIEYLGRYTHRIAISNSRVLAVDEHGVSFRYKDYADADRTKVMTLTGEEFLRRLLLHVLPKGLQRLRHFGFLANRCRQTRVAQIRGALAQAATAQAEAKPLSADTSTPAIARCPSCNTGQLRRQVLIGPTKRLSG